MDRNRFAAYCVGIVFGMILSDLIIKSPHLSPMNAVVAFIGMFILGCGAVLFVTEILLDVFK